MGKTLEIYKKCKQGPFGNWLFSRLLCFKAPYFSSIKPLFVDLRPGYCEVHLKKRRAVTNHIGTVHAIAMCNVSELAAGTMLDASIPEHLRWIPKGMTVSYLKLAKTDLTATCTATLEEMSTPGELPMVVKVTDTRGDQVFQAEITMHLSEKRRK